MTTQRPRLDDLAKSSTREKILAVALDLFAEHGFAGTSIRTLARNVGLSESSLYSHFDSKEAIYTALIDEHGPATSAIRLDAHRYDGFEGDPEGFCRAYAFDLIRDWSDPIERKFHELFITERNRLPGARERFANHLFARSQSRVIELFEGFAAKKLIIDRSPGDTARLFLAGLTFIRVELFILPSEPPDEEVIARSVEAFLAHFLGLILLSRPA